MTVKELKTMLEGQDETKNIVFLSCAGLEWNVDTKVVENPKVIKTNKGDTDQVVIYIK